MLQHNTFADNLFRNHENKKTVYRISQNDGAFGVPNSLNLALSSAMGSEFNRSRQMHKPSDAHLLVQLLTQAFHEFSVKFVTHCSTCVRYP